MSIHDMIELVKPPLPQECEWGCDKDQLENHYILPRKKYTGYGDFQCNKPSPCCKTCLAVQCSLQGRCGSYNTNTKCTNR